MSIDVTSSLLDRLRNDAGGSGIKHVVPVAAGQELEFHGKSRRQVAQTVASLRQQIERELVMLLETRHMEADTDLSAWPLVRKSVLNYGVPDLTGTTGSSLDLPGLERKLTEAIKRFEPRLDPHALKVKCRLVGTPQSEVWVAIESDFGPTPLQEFFRTEVAICLGSGRCRLPLQATAS